MEAYLDITFDIIGTIGVVCCLIAFHFVQSGKISAQQLTYPMLNLIGAVLLFISLMWKWNTPSVIIEIAWISISLHGIYNILKARKKEQQDGQH